MHMHMQACTCTCMDGYMHMHASCMRTILRAKEKTWLQVCICMHIWNYQLHEESVKGSWSHNNTVFVAIEHTLARNNSFLWHMAQFEHPIPPKGFFHQPNQTKQKHSFCILMFRQTNCSLAPTRDIRGPKNLRGVFHSKKHQFLFSKPWDLFFWKKISKKIRDDFLWQNPLPEDADMKNGHWFTIWPPCVQVGIWYIWLRRCQKMQIVAITILLCVLCIVHRNKDTIQIGKTASPQGG